MEFYKTNKANPFSGCLPTIFQLVFLIAIYRVLFNISNAGLLVDPKELYINLVANPGQINQYFLGIMELSKPLSLGSFNPGSILQIILIVAAAAAQYFQMKMIMPVAPRKKTTTPDLASTMSSQMMYLGPLLTLFIGIKFPAGLALYWLVSTIFAIIQQRQLMKKPDENKA